ncbi:TonB-dependent receptor [Lutimonas saemankumensis]|uniref:TonB-dependent receptor n=1 Tax=Lutimonas saemankumensis TaxID=483016 RepID=UPI001CD42E45|nr:TonB-dependent receptor [Lutimonas saemankumensis]MCA0933479.1 TonB-dependent receptor [Lutimonas saemankumensis]
MKKFLFLLLLFPALSAAQNKYSLSGTVKDKSSGESLFGATVFIEGTSIGTTTNEYGFYSISAPEGSHTLIISYLGFDNIKKDVLLDKDQNLNIELSESSSQLNEVVLQTEDSEDINLRKPQMSVSKLKVGTIKQMPAVLGEVDIIKSLQLLPGVTNNGEGSSGFNVRGGSVDQNLVLLDETIIYNTSHLLGFFSIFNSDAIKDIKLYKGNIPSKFGGRASSVLDVRQKDGNNKNFALTGGIGTVSTRLAVEGPIVKDRSSFLVAGRGSYAHLFLKLDEDLKDNSAYFYDLNLKTNFEINENNQLFLSGYFGRDVFEFNENFKNSYGNSSGNLRWNHVFNDKIFSNLSLNYSKYDYDLEISAFEFDWLSEIDNINLKYALSYYLNNDIKLDFGLNGIHYLFNPGIISPTTETSGVNYLKLDQKRAFEGGLYIGAEHQVSSKLSIQYGLRYSNFARMGGQAIVQYENDQPVVYDEELEIYKRGTPADAIDYDKGEVIRGFGNLEPRLAFAYELGEHSSIKAGYSRVAQYIHLISNTTSVTPLDVWAPSGPYIEPQLSNQYAVGYFRKLKNSGLSLEVEAYYKDIANRIDYIDGSDLIGNNTIETEILNGESKAYGLEFLMRKTKGDFTGWLAYTWSKSEQRTPGGTAGGPGINEGEWYYTPYDRTHDISMTGTYRLNKKWRFSANLIYQTGRPVTYPNGQYEYEGQSIASYSDRNSDRLPAYHRLDLSAILVPGKPGKKWKGEWVFSIYNVYNRRNAASITFSQNRETGINEATRIAIFGIVPSVTYNFKF